MVRNPVSLYPFGGLQRDLNEPLLSLHREMNRLFGDVFRGGLPTTRTGAAEQIGLLVPHLDVSETDKEIHIRAELPGVKAEDVHLTLLDDVLTIQGEKAAERRDDTERYHFVERSYGTFQRSIRMPHGIRPEDVQAHLDQGVLTVTLPKPQQAAGRSRIEVRRPGTVGPRAGEVKAAQVSQPAASDDIRPKGDRGAELSGKTTNPVVKPAEAGPASSKNKKTAAAKKA